MSSRSQSETGLIIGKFLPPHAGHLHLIEEARKQVKRLTILVCTLKNEPIPGELRFQWMTELCSDSTVEHLTDENPSEPQEHPDFWNIWTGSIRRFCPAGPDVVFTSETYGDQLAQCLGARHIQVDLDRKRFSISGTKVRVNPYEHWEFLPPCVRAHYVKRVVLIGAECTGKTTLAERLAKQYQTVWVPEFGREYVARKQAPPEASDIPKIAEGHLKAEDELARQANRVLICDTDLIVTSVLSEHYFGSCPEWVTKASHDRKYDLHLLTEPDIPWEADAFQRDGPKVRAKLHKRFKQELEKRDIPFLPLGGSVEERVQYATQAIDRLFRLQPIHRNWATD